ncbi:glycosyltransferase family 2 protein [Nitrosopumilus sp.]|uniref:glycosyltransferase family 2 protein n=1 Tax=Nitrosopumilus sp. TaxID=2024843 RepID=UPI003D0B5217
MEILIGLPAYNEAKNLPKIIPELQRLSYKIAICNDGSTDATGEIAEKYGAIVINHSKNLGYGSSIKSIFKKARELKVDILVTFDADGQHRIEDIANVIQPIIDKQSDIVIGSRFLDDSEKNVPKYRRAGIRVITKITNISIKEKLTDSQSGFRAYSKSVLEELNLDELGMGVSTEILIKSSSKNFKILEVPIKILYQGNTSTHNPITHGTSVILSTIKYTSLQRPLTFYGIPSVIFLIIGSIFSFYSIQYYVEVGRLNTNLTIISAGTVLIGIVLMITAILLFSLVSIIREGKN